MYFEAQVKRTSINSKFVPEIHKEKEMVAFRKAIPVLALLGMALGLSSKASAQTVNPGQPLTCTANAGVPPLVRAEGYTELVGDLVLICTGGNSATPFNANFQIFLNTNVTSRLLSAGGSEATLLIDEPTSNPAGTTTGSAFCPAPVTVPPGGYPLAGNTCNIGVGPAGTNPQRGTFNAFTAQQTAQPNSVVWAGIPIIPPGTTGTRTIRITNVRANAAGLGTSNTLIPTQIVAFISVSGSQSVAINNPQQTVAYIQQGLQFTVTNCSGGSVSGANSFAQCTGFGGTLATDPTSSGSAPIGLRFREGFQTAFKPRITATQTPSIPGVVYNSESGFIGASTVISGTGFAGDVQGYAGVASNGTRLAARFANIPAGVRLYASTTGVVQTAGSVSGQAAAILVNADQNGAGGVILTSGSSTPLTGITPTATLQCGGVTPSGVGLGTTGAVGLTAAGVNGVEIPVVNGTAVAVWEVVGSDPALIEDVFVLIGEAAAANPANNLPAIGTGTVTGNFAPFYAASTGANLASAGLPVPRFIDNPTSATAIIVNACQTNLLFPFVTAQAGFDTGIAISNTSRDPFSGNSGRLQQGTCTLNFYGSTVGGGAAPAAATTTSNVAAGSQLLYVLSSGGNLGLTQNAAGFQGYIIAQCNFRYAHGFAFITDGAIGQARVAEGYLALVMDAAIGTRTGASSEVLSH